MVPKKCKQILKDTEKEYQLLKVELGKNGISEWFIENLYKEDL